MLVTFGFSFADEHILNLVMRSLSNPGLQVFVCCYSKPGHIAMEDKFRGHRNVKCLMLQNGEMNFTAFNEQVLVWPEASTLKLEVPTALAVLPAALETPRAADEFEDLI
ncbi:hypothetical protein D3C79_920180 [compost metagenome]